MKHILLRVPLLFTLALFLFTFHSEKIFAQTALPVPDHVVVLILENHAESQLIGSSAAPYINSLINGTNSALFIHSYGIEHPSQPNYLDLFSGCNQGVINDYFPVASPFTTPNIARQLLDSGKTFITYSEGLPSVGFNGNTSGAYARKHNPAANWMGTGMNQIPITTNQPLTAFPSSDFTTLPTVSYVVPNLTNDMHDGTDPSRITLCDTWINNKMSAYIEWAKTHNSLLILTCDEDDNNNNNKILTLITGQKVKGGTYTDTINHYNILRTIEDFYRLPYACKAATVSPVTSCWKVSANTTEEAIRAYSLSVYPNPCEGRFTLQMETSTTLNFLRLQIFDVFGEIVFEEKLIKTSAKEIDLMNVSEGIYFIRIIDENKVYRQKIIVKQH